MRTKPKCNQLLHPPLTPFNRAAIDSSKKGGKQRGENQSAQKSQLESFSKHYNKKLKVSEEEVPFILLELN